MRETQMIKIETKVHQRAVFQLWFPFTGGTKLESLRRVSKHGEKEHSAHTEEWPGPGSQAKPITRGTVAGCTLSFTDSGCS